MVVGCPEMSKMGEHFSMFFSLMFAKRQTFWCCNALRNPLMSWNTTCWRSNCRNRLINDFPAEHCLHLPCSMTIQETAPHQQLLAGGMPALTLSPPWYDDLASLLPLASYVHWPSICAVSTILVVLWCLFAPLFFLNQCCLRRWVTLLFTCKNRAVKFVS